MGKASWGPWPGAGGGGGGSSVVAGASYLALSDLLPGGDGAGSAVFYLANRGTENGVTNQADPIGFPIGAVPVNTLLATVPQGAGTNPFVVTVDVNGVPSGLTVTIPGGSPAGTVVSAVHALALASTDKVDIRVAYTQPNGGDFGVSAVLKTNTNPPADNLVATYMSDVIDLLTAVDNIPMGIPLRPGFLFVALSGTLLLTQNTGATTGGPLEWAVGNSATHDNVFATLITASEINSLRGFIPIQGVVDVGLGGPGNGALTPDAGTQIVGRLVTPLTGATVLKGRLSIQGIWLPT